MLVQACLHRLANVSYLQWQTPWANNLPNVGNILLQASDDNSQKYLESVAQALARELNCALLVVDDSALSRISQSVLGKALRYVSPATPPPLKYKCVKGDMES